MPARIKKYNPGFLSEDELVASFCVRGAEFESLIDSLRASTGASNSHTLVIGPRGSGKTYLLRRVAAEPRRDPSLSVFRPVVFAEESYGVSTVGEFWLECLDHLAEQAPQDERADLRLSHDDIKATADDRELADRSLGAILSFADRHGERIVLVVENLNMLFADMADPEAGWRLRHTLQTEPRIVLLGSATSRFDEIDHPDRALYELFRVITLRPLDTQGCEALWQAISGKSLGDRGDRAVRPLEILTGGNPRLLAIMARFGASLSLERLMDSLLDLVDDHTDYFKGHLESLPAQERRVYLALARLWRPATAREVADQARLNSSLCSALLKRLVDRGAVAIEGGTPRRRQYYLTERLYNIYYLLRRGGGTSRVVEALIDFMVCLYSSSDLWDALRRMHIEHVRATGRLPGEVTRHLTKNLLAEASDLEDRGDVARALEIYGDLTGRLLADGDSESEVLSVAPVIGQVGLLQKSKGIEAAIGLCDDFVERFGDRTDPKLVLGVSTLLVLKSAMLANQQDISAAIKTADQALRRVDMADTDARIRLEVGATLAKADALSKGGCVQEANALIDDLVGRLERCPESQVAWELALVLSFKGLIGGQTLSEREAATLLSCLARIGGGWAETAKALFRFSSVVGHGRALELIGESGASEVLLPLVTALQRELGQEPNVSKEVSDVAEDIRRENRAGASSGASATRSLSQATVEVGGRVTVTIAAESLGSFGAVEETLPEGFTYLSTTHTEAPNVSGQKLTFVIFGTEASFSYTVAVTAADGTYDMFGIVTDDMRRQYAVIGDASVTIGGVSKGKEMR